MLVRVAKLMAEAPSRRRLVEILRDPLDHDQHAAGAEDLGDVVERRPGIVDVVEGDRRDDRVGGPLGPVILERGAPVGSPLRSLGIDARRVVPGAQQRRDVPAVRPAAELDDPGRRRRQLAADERPGRGEPDLVGGGPPGRVVVTPACVHAEW
jgi:hypothetical protein